MLNFLAKEQIVIESAGFNELFQPSLSAPLPWYLSPLRAQGFLGRILARKLSDQGILSNPESWDIHSILLAALSRNDVPGSLILGQQKCSIEYAPSLIPEKNMGATLDSLAINVAKTLPLGSSAGGEQPKFTAMLQSGEHVLVKFSAPKGAPFGDRWSDLLCAELLCNTILARHGYNVAQGDQNHQFHRDKHLWRLAHFVI